MSVLDPYDAACLRADDAEHELADLAHWTRRMLQALDAYWLHYEGYDGFGHPRTEGAEERWWGRFERYRARVEATIGQVTKGVA